MWDLVTQSLEEYVQGNWDLCPVVFENEPVPDANLDYYARFTVLYGVNRGICLGDPFERRQVGVLYMSLFARPATGMAKLNQLSSQVSQLFLGKIIRPSIEGTAPVVNVRDPQLTTDPNAKDNWVKAVVSFDFYFDTE